MMQAIRPLKKQNFKHPDVVEAELEDVVIPANAENDGHYRITDIRYEQRRIRVAIASERDSFTTMWDTDYISQQPRTYAEAKELLGEWNWYLPTLHYYARTLDAISNTELKKDVQSHLLDLIKNDFKNGTWTGTHIVGDANGADIVHEHPAFEASHTFRADYGETVRITQLSDEQSRLLFMLPADSAEQAFRQIDDISVMINMPRLNRDSYQFRLDQQAAGKCIVPTLPGGPHFRTVYRARAISILRDTTDYSLFKSLLQ